MSVLGGEQGDEGVDVAVVTGGDSDRLKVLTFGCGDARASIENQGFECLAVETWTECQRCLHEAPVRALILRMEGDAERLSRAVSLARQEAHLVDVLIWAPAASPEDVRQALKAGAVDVIMAKQPQALAKALARVVHRQRFLPRLQKFELAQARSSRFEGLVSRSIKMWSLFETVTQIAPSTANVLILGETGVGKELLARAVHKYSGRRGRFVAVDCGGIPEGLVETELFGHVEGTFTGATRSKMGLFRSAEGGTLFLDEVGNLPLASQHSLLRVLQQQAVRPVGSHEELPVDVRIIAATSSALDWSVQQHKFRDDLLFRLDVIRLEIPPLRKRPEDVLHLFGYFQRKLSKKYRVQAPELSDDFFEALLAYPWPGNVRELENIVERLVLTHHGKRLSRRQFEPLIRSSQSAPRPPLSFAQKPAAPRPQSTVDLGKTLSENLGPLVEDFERRYLVEALKAKSGRVGETASLAGISPRTLLRKMKNYGLKKSDYRP